MTTSDRRDRNHDGSVSVGEDFRGLFRYFPHPHIAARQELGPVTLADQHGDGLNGKLAAWGTRLFGSMPTFYLFVIYGALGAVFVRYQSTLLYWSNWVQLWSLPLIMVGGIVLGKMAEQRAQQTFLDTEAILDQNTQTQKHLAEQDAVSLEMRADITELKTLVTELHDQLKPPPPGGVTP